MCSCCSAKQPIWSDIWRSISHWDRQPSSLSNSPQPFGPCFTQSASSISCGVGSSVVSPAQPLAPVTAPSTLKATTTATTAPRR